jgi:plastocyanin
MMRRWWTAAVARHGVTFVLTASILASGCGGDGNGPGADSATAPAECNPVGTDLAPRATQQLQIELQDFLFSPATVEARAGVATFAATNSGTENHELAFLPGGGEVPMAQGEPDEAALERAGAFELEAFGPGMTCNATYDLAPGTYTLFCIVTSPDGRTHYDKGMRGRLVVR